LWSGGATPFGFCWIVTGQTLFWEVIIRPGVVGTKGGLGGEVKNYISLRKVQRERNKGCEGLNVGKVFSQKNRAGRIEKLQSKNGVGRVEKKVRP